MSCYRCNKCEGIFDSDYVGCEQHPHNECELLCLDCFDLLNEPSNRKEVKEFNRFMDRLEKHLAEREPDDEEGPGDEYYENLMEWGHSA